MPHATMNYPFEWKVCEAAGRLSQLLAGGRYGRTMLIVFNSDGAVLSLTFERPEDGWHAFKHKLHSNREPHLFYDPFDAPEYTWLAWTGIAQTTMERLMGRPFEAADFEPLHTHSSRGPALDPPGNYPASWGVMF
jgi:hypothetical protein